MDNNNALATLSRVDAELLERTIIGGDLARLTPQDRVRYVVAVCHSVGLNPLTRPFEYLILQGKMVLYAKKEATEQLRELHDVRVTKLDKQTVVDNNEDYYEVTAYGCNKKGREDADIGVVCLSGLRGQQRADAKMKATTKAKRRLTLSLCGLGMLDESEVDFSPVAVRATEVVNVQGENGAATPTEQTILFNTPEADRAALIQRAKVAVARIEKARVQELKQQHFGDAEAKYESVDLAALVAFVQAVEEVRL